MEGTILGTLLLIYLCGILVAWLSPLYLSSAPDRNALRQIALLWPALLVSVLIVLGAALIRSVYPHRERAR